jgi:hypothetical protein
MLDIELRVDQLIKRKRASRRQYRLRLAVIGEAGCHFAQCTPPQARQIDPISHRRAVGIDQPVVKFDALAAPVPEYRRIARQGDLGRMRHQIDELAPRPGQHFLGPFLEKFAEPGAIDALQPGAAAPQPRRLTQSPGVGIFVAFRDPKAFGHHRLYRNIVPGHVIN